MWAKLIPRGMFSQVNACNLYMLTAMPLRPAFTKGVARLVQSTAYRLRGFMCENIPLGMSFNVGSLGTNRSVHLWDEPGKNILWVCFI